MIATKTQNIEKLCNSNNHDYVVANNDNSVETLDELLNSAIESIRCGLYKNARCILKSAVTQNIENPEIYNLLGISYELEGDRIKACKFYRVSYYMDQTFTPAASNLERLSGFWYKGPSTISWGFTKKGDE